jgi:REP element-mobilizing transposase RayT
MHQRRSIRLKGYDYTRPGAYFVTLCAWQRQCLFGEVVDGEMRLNRLGEVVLHAWQDLPHHYPHLELGGFCVMPNHVHAIMILVEDDHRRGGSVDAEVSSSSQASNDRLQLPDQAETRPYTPVRHGLPEIVRAFKSFSARRVNLLRHMPGMPVWQRNYYEHIIRDDAEWCKIHDYILTNPARWEEDRENPAFDDGGGTIDPAPNIG